MSVKSVTVEFDALLKPIGFVREKTTWNRVVDDLVQVIDVQTSADRARMTINSGVLNQSAHQLIWGGAAPAFVDEPRCTVRARVGELMDGRDIWWVTADKNAALEMTKAVTQVVLPFLERVRRSDASMEWLERTQLEAKRQPIDVLALAVFANMCGDSRRACELLAHQRTRSIGAWRSRNLEVSKRLGCPDDQA